MNEQQRAAMQMALEALDCRYNDNKVNAAIIALREALAQPQGEWVDFTDDEIKAAYEIWWEENGNHAFPIWVGAKSAIAKFKAKNTPVQREQQEPVAWKFDWYSEDENKWYTSHTSNFDKTVNGEVKTRNVVPLYTAPQSVEAAVLAEREACAKVCDTEDVHRGNWYAAAIRARGEK